MRKDNEGDDMSGLSEMANGKRAIEIGGKTFYVGELEIGEMADFETEMLAEKMRRLRLAGLTPDEIGAAAAAIQAEHTPQSCIRAVLTPVGMLTLMWVVLRKQDKAVTKAWLGRVIKNNLRDDPTVDDFMEATGLGQKIKPKGDEEPQEGPEKNGKAATA